MFIIVNRKLRNTVESPVLVLNASISYVVSNSAGGSTITTSSGILDVEETFEEIQIKLAESLI